MDYMMIALAVLVFVAVIAVVAALTRLYVRALPDQAIIRTGLRGEKVIVGGGCTVLPFVESYRHVPLFTLQLDISRTGDSALITKDNLRADIDVKIFVRVKPEEASIRTAARTLGTLLTSHANDRMVDRAGKSTSQLTMQIEGKLVDALRNAASLMDLEELQAKRAEFVKTVQDTINLDLDKNGLMLESVALNRLDQAKVTSIDPNNLFNALGLRSAARRIAEANTERAKIEADAEVKIATEKASAEKAKLRIDQEVASQKLEQVKALEFTKSDTDLATAKKQSENAIQVAEARAKADRAANDATAEVIAAKAEADTMAQRKSEVAMIEKEQAARVAQEQQQAAVAKASNERSNAQAEAALARAKAIEAEQTALTVEAKAKAEREKVVAVIQAQQIAESDVAQVTVRARAEAEAAENTAMAAIREAEGEATATRMRAEADANAKRLIGEAQAAAVAALKEAENKIGENSMRLQLETLKVQTLPSIIAAMVKPMESIDSVRVNLIEGLGGQAWRPDVIKTADGEVIAQPAGQPSSMITDAISKIGETVISASILSAIGKNIGMDIFEGGKLVDGVHKFATDTLKTRSTKVAE